MYCSKCGKQIPELSIVCPFCTFPTNRQAIPTAATSPPQVIYREAPRRHTFARFLGWFAVLMLLVIGGLALAGVAGGLFFMKTGGDGAGDMTIFPRRSLQTLTDDTFDVPAGSYYYINFTVPSSARVTGSFFAKGGMKNDIECVIFDDDGFLNFQNGNRAQKVYYHSKGYVTTAKIEKELPAGSYVMVFNNKDALISGKTVTAKIDLEY